MLIHYAQILCSCEAGGGAGEHRRKKPWSVTGGGRRSLRSQVSSQIRQGKKTSVLITQQTGLELQVAYCLSPLLSSVSEVLSVGRTVSSSPGAAGLWIVTCRILAGSQIYGPDFVPRLLLNG